MVYFSLCKFVLFSAVPLRVLEVQQNKGLEHCSVFSSTHSFLYFSVARIGRSLECHLYFLAKSVLIRHPEGNSHLCMVTYKLPAAFTGLLLRVIPIILLKKEFGALSSLYP